MESECQPDTIEQQYEQAIRLDRNMRKSRREEEEEREAMRVEKNREKLKK